MSGRLAISDAHNVQNRPPPINTKPGQSNGRFSLLR
jgi:hypothetical protein